MNKKIKNNKNMNSPVVGIDIGISLDGVDQEHDRIRGVKGNFEKVDKLITDILELRKEAPNYINVAIGTTLVDETIENYNSVRDYATSRGLTHVVAWYNNAEYYGAIPKEKELHKQEVKEIVESLPKTLTNRKWSKWLDGKPIKFDCFALYTFALLRSNGNIAPCLTYASKSIGNVREESPTEIWKSERAKRIRRELVKPCKGCLNDWATNWSFQSSVFPYLKGVVLDIIDLIKR